MSDNYKIETLQSADFNLLAIRDILKTNWYWFVISVLVFAGAAWLYNEVSPPVYQHTATVLVKDKEKTEDAFIEKKLFNVNSNLENERLIFQSRLLMMEVVKRLGLTTEYSMKDKLRDKVLYPDAPVEVRFLPELKRSVSFSVEILSETQYLMDDFSADGEWSSTGTFGHPLKTPAGEVIVSRSSTFPRAEDVGIVYVSCSTPAAVTAGCLGKLKVERAEENATLLSITYLDSNSNRAEAIISTLINVYNDDAVEDKNRILMSTALFIDERLQMINSELGDVDGNIENYKKTNKLTNLSSEASLYLHNNDQNRQEAVRLANQMELVLMIKNYLNDPIKSEELLPANSGIMDTGVEGLIGQYNEKVLMRDKLYRNSGERNPSVVALDVQIEALRESVFRSLSNLHSSLRVKMQDARRQEGLAASYIGTVPTQEKYIMSVERQQKIKEELYLYLLNKREENALSIATVEKNIRVIDTPYVSGMASGVSFIVLLCVSVIVGLLFPYLCFYTKPMLDVSVRSRKDVKEALTAPFLGEIPRNKKVKEAIVIDKDMRDNTSEAFRVLRANLDSVVTKKEGAKVLMFTSTNQGSGKTFISSNLAVSLSMTGKRVIYLCMDIRKGSGHKPNGGFAPGITNYLSASTDSWRELVDASEEYPGLFTIHSGPVPPNPVELLLGDRLDMLVNDLRKEYDYVVIDTVPYGIMADAQIINRVADITIYVIREGLMDRRDLPEVENLYKENKLHNMTVVLNDSGVKGSYYGYVHKSDYKYGYGYGYRYGKKGKKN